MFHVSMIEGHKLSRSIHKLHIILCISLEQASAFVLESGILLVCLES